MIKAGPLYGLVRARNHALDFAFRYFLSGIPWALLASVLMKSSLHSDAAIALMLQSFFMMLLIHLYSLVVVLPAALVANFAAIRLFRRRSWRREPWRAWMAGAVSAPLVWAGSYVLMVAYNPPEFLERTCDAGRILYFLGSIVLFSNLGVFLAWILPERAGREPQLFKRDKVPRSGACA